MKHTLLVCLLAASIAAPSASYATTSEDEQMNRPEVSIIKISEEPLASNQSASVKPGKSKKYKKKMNKQMKKRKRH
jgi:hypothetical protein